MGMELIDGTRTRRGKHSFPTVSIYANMKRFVFNIEATALLYVMAGGELVDYIQTFKDTKNPDVLYIKPCEKDDPGAKKLGRGRKLSTGRFFDGKATIQGLGWEIESGITIRILEDSKRYPGVLIVDKNEIVE